MLTTQWILAQTLNHLAQIGAMYNSSIKIMLRKSPGKVWTLVFVHPWLQSTKTGHTRGKKWKMLTTQRILAQTLNLLAQTGAMYNSSIKIMLRKSLGKVWAVVFVHPWLQSTKTGTVGEWVKDAHCTMKNCSNALLFRANWNYVQ